MKKRPLGFPVIAARIRVAKLHRHASADMVLGHFAKARSAEKQWAWSGLAWR
ncbi:hypothetical protein P245_15030 [Comamonas thiooxydans]|uniref:Uncharacterized protein n=1 Tax=Comamonas thiooxydans TaxID=363952 RepID=A0A0E3BJD2_9BURK|nr:hypothetical protein P245_15030 [Comamonas thiooxydans]